MNNDRVNNDNGATTALFAVLVIALIGFGIWFMMRGNAAPAPAENGDAELNIDISGSPGGGGTPAPAPSPSPTTP